MTKRPNPGLKAPPSHWRQGKFGEEKLCIKGTEMGFEGPAGRALGRSGTHCSADFWLLALIVTKLRTQGRPSPVHISSRNTFAAFCSLLVPGQTTGHDFHLGGLSLPWVLVFPLAMGHSWAWCTGNEAVAKSEVFQYKKWHAIKFSQLLFMYFATHPLGWWYQIPGTTGRCLKVEFLVNFTCPLTLAGIANSQKILA